MGGGKSPIEERLRPALRGFAKGTKGQKLAAGIFRGHDCRQFRDHGIERRPEIAFAEIALSNPDTRQVDFDREGPDCDIGQIALFDEVQDRFRVDVLFENVRQFELVVPVRRRRYAKDVAWSEAGNGRPI